MASERTATGQFAKGVSGNPNGRAKMPDGLADGIRAFCESDRLKKLKALAKNKDPRIALAAWQLLYDRGFGRPVTPTELKIEGVDMNAAHLEALRELGQQHGQSAASEPEETSADAVPIGPADTLTH